MSSLRTLAVILTSTCAALLAGCPGFLSHTTDSTCAHVDAADVPGLEGTFRYRDTASEDEITVELERLSEGLYQANMDAPAGKHQFEVKTCKLYGVWTAEVELGGIWGQLPLEVGGDGNVSTPRLEQGQSYAPVVQSKKLTGYESTVSFVDQYESYVVANRTRAASGSLAYILAKAPRDLVWTRLAAAPEPARKPSTNREAPDSTPVPSAAERAKLEAACSKGTGTSCTELARLYADGLGVEKDVDKMVVLLQEACRHGDSKGCMMLGGVGALMLSGQLGEPEHARGVKLLEASCEAGQADPCVLVGLVYECEAGEESACQMLSSGLGTQYERGVLLRERAAEAYRSACKLGQQAGCDR
jgi:hypothetical protein